MKDFFVSYSAKDTSWAEWVAWEISRLGYDLVMQRWDFIPGTNFAAAMNTAIRDCKRLILILSTNSLKSKFVTAEWTAYFAKDPDGTERSLVPLRVDECKPDGLLGQIVYSNIFGLSENAAKLELKRAIGHVEARPRAAPIFHGVKPSSTIVGPAFPEQENNPSAISGQNPFNVYLASVKKQKLPSLRTRYVGRAFVTHHLHSLTQNLLKSGRRPVALVVDIDGMGNINNKFGFVCGDLVMDRLLHYCEALRTRYLVARIGDDTILTVLTHVELEKAFEQARKIVRRMAEDDWTVIAADLFVHCSSGVAKFYPNENGFDAVARALDGQRIARAMGGNRAMMGPLFEPTPQPLDELDISTPTRVFTDT